MGTDIHLSAEVDIVDLNGKHIRWDFVPGPIKTCWSCEGTGRSTNRQTGESMDCTWCSRPKWEYGVPGTPDYECEMNDSYVSPGKTREHWYHDRNYRVFAALAGVRNGHGFAGVYTHEPLVPISQPRGIPHDITDGTRTILSNEHSGSWLWMDEVLAYDWQQGMRQSGVVTLDEYRTYVQTGKPESWCGDVQGGSIRHVTNDEANHLIAQPQPYDKSIYTRIEWADTLDDYADGFLEAMRDLMTKVGERRVRLVFDFDSVKKACPFCSGVVSADARKFDAIYDHHLESCPRNPTKKKETANGSGDVA